MPVPMPTHPMAPYQRPKNQPGTSTSDTIATHTPKPIAAVSRPPPADEQSEDEPNSDEHGHDHPSCVGTSRGVLKSDLGLAA